jgi:hypothetical protein
MKERNKLRLQQDMTKYCEQIGITDSLKLVFSRKEINELRHWHGWRGESKSTYGCCYDALKVIYVAEHTSGGRYQLRLPMRRKGWYRYVYKPYNYIYQRRVLVHELIHYRWPSMKHGKKFDRRIREILRGHRFDPQPEQKQQKHQPEQKKEYNGTLDYFLVYSQ